jgi:hypothetical protein
VRPSLVTVALLLLLSVLSPPLSSASDRNRVPGTTGQSSFSADDFDWREMVPYLFAASTLPGEQGIKEVLGNSKVLRAYIANEVRAECMPDQGRCAAKRDGFTLQGEVSKRIDGIIKEEIFRRNKTAVVDYKLAAQPFPFSEIAAYKSEKQPDAYFVLALSDHSYTAADVQEKYGTPYDTDIFQWYSVYKYRMDTPDYTSKAVFEIDPVDGAVIKVAISLKPKKRKSPH